MRDRRQALASAIEVSEYLGVPLNTLYIWRVRGKGPKGARVGRHLRYRWADVDAYVEKLSGEQGFDSVVQSR